MHTLTNSRATQSSEQCSMTLPEAAERMPYQAPQLTVHGRFQQVTLQVSIGGGTGSCQEGDPGFPDDC